MKINRATICKKDHTIYVMMTYENYKKIKMCLVFVSKLPEVTFFLFFFFSWNSSLGKTYYKASTETHFQYCISSAPKQLNFENQIF